MGVVDIRSSQSHPLPPKNKQKKNECKDLYGTKSDLNLTLGRCNPCEDNRIMVTQGDQ